MSSSILASKLPGALPRQDLAAIRVPVLMLHHADDVCRACQARAAPAVIRGPSNAPVRQLQRVSGSGPVSGDACAPLCHHGFIGIEDNAVRRIAEWIRQPRND